MNPDSLRFEIHTENDETYGRFIAPDTEHWIDVDGQFNALQENMYQTTFGDYEDTCKQIIKSEPMYLDAYAHAGMINLPPYLDDEESTAARWYRKGLKVAMSLIPDDFEGKIEWGFIENRPFLRLHHGLILSYLRQKKITEAVRLMEQHLAWNPSDNIGVRFLLGEAYMSHPKHIHKAKVHLQSVADERPSAHYTLGLLFLFEGNYLQAITSLRLGIASNPYVAEALLGSLALAQHPYWHRDSRCMPSEAEGYLELLGWDLWENSNDGLLFLDWLFSCSKCLRERADFMEINEGLTSVHDINERGTIVKKLNNLTQQITDFSSKNWLYKITTRTGDEIWPWEYEDE